MLNPGDCIGDWEIVLPLGQGGMGSVYRCRHALSSRIEAAVKVLKPTDIPGARERFIREAESLHNLDHPAIVSTSGFGLDPSNGLLWLAMDLVHGEDLEQLLHRGGFPVERVAAVFGPVAAGLAYAHNLGIVHRDIKPANIMLRRDGKAVLLDFGIAVHEGQERLTQEGVVPGTVAYAAPEQVTGEAPVDPAAADVYALGQVLCECLTGEFRYPRTPDMGEHKRSMEILRSKLRSRAMDPGPNFAPRIRALVRQATDPDPERRGPPLLRWREILDAGPIRITAEDEQTDLHASSADLRDAVAASRATAAAPSAPPVDVAMPDAPGPADLSPILDLDTDVHGGRGGSVPWAWVALGVLLVLLIGGGVLAVGAVGGTAAWLSWRTEPSQTELIPLQEVLRPIEATPDPAPPEPVEVPPQVTPPPPKPIAVGTKPTPSPVRAATGEAQLVVSSVQRAAVYVNGSLVRTTPMTKRLAPGVYDVTIMKGDGQKKRFSVHLDADEKARRIWDFDQEQWRSFEGGIDEANLPLRPGVSGVKARVQALPAIGQCLKEHAPRAAVTTRFVVAPDGSVVTGGFVQAAIKGGPAEDCVDKALRSLRFAASQVGAAVSVDLQP